MFICCMGNICILGTSHIAKQSVEQVKKAIEQLNPDIIALELDRDRLEGLFMPKRPKPRLRDIRRVGAKGLLFQMLGAWAEKKLGDVVGVKPGAEMKEAATIARARQKKLALIDQPIGITLRRLSKGITWREKFTFLKEGLSALFFHKTALSFDLRTVPKEEIILRMLEEVRVKYPNVYRVLLTERNHYMAKKLRMLTEHFPEASILAVVGAGHVEGMKKIMKECSFPSVL